MKSIKFFAVASAVALLSTAGFTSCNQKNAPVGPGNYNGDVVTVTGGTAYEGNTPYVWVYSDKLKMSGWVNATFLK